jgi:hypothetical protein
VIDTTRIGDILNRGGSNAAQEAGQVPAPPEPAFLFLD